LVKITEPLESTPLGVANPVQVISCMIWGGGGDCYKWILSPLNVTLHTR
jgi:hypothetical protein